MQTAAAPTNVFTRNDTFFGVCEALGEDFRFNPIYLRVALGVGLLWNPLAVVGTYAALGVIVGLSRLLFPNPRVARASADKPAATADNDADMEKLAAAA